MQKITEIHVIKERNKVFLHNLRSRRQEEKEEVEQRRLETIKCSQRRDRPDFTIDNKM